MCSSGQPIKRVPDGAGSVKRREKPERQQHCEDDDDSNYGSTYHVDPSSIRQWRWFVVAGRLRWRGNRPARWFHWLFSRMLGVRFPNRLPAFLPVFLRRKRSSALTPVLLFLLLYFASSLRCLAISS